MDLRSVTVESATEILIKLIIISGGEMKRITTRFNDREEAELELLKKTYGLTDDSKAIKMAIEWINHYITNVTNTFFPPSFDVILLRRTVSNQLHRKVYDELKARDSSRNRP